MHRGQPIHTTLIIPTYNQVELLSRLIDGLNATAEQFHAPLELIVVDNNSDNSEALTYLDNLKNPVYTGHFETVSVIRYPHPFNYAAINNLAVANSQGEYVCFINNDIEVIETSWLMAMHKPLKKPETGCVGAMLYYPDNTIQHAGVYLDPTDVAGHLYKQAPRGSEGKDRYLLSEQPVPAVTAACLLMKQELFWKVNGFNEAFEVAFNDVDLCLKVSQAGFQNIWTPHAELYHHESKSRHTGKKRNWRSRLRHRREVRLMKKLWQSELASDTLRLHHATSKPNTGIKAVGL